MFLTCKQCDGHNYKHATNDYIVTTTENNIYKLLIIFAFGNTWL